MTTTNGAASNQLKLLTSLSEDTPMAQNITLDALKRKRKTPKGGATPEKLTPENKRRHKVSQAGIKILIAEFRKNENWDRKKQAELAERLNMSRLKIYKWNYD